MRGKAIRAVALLVLASVFISVGAYGVAYALALVSGASRLGANVYALRVNLGILDVFQMVAVVWLTMDLRDRWKETRQWLH